MNVKKSNRTRVLSYIFRNAPVSRAVIAEKTNITPATVTMTTAGLIEEGMIMTLGEETNDQNVTAGRKRILIDICPDYRYAVGIEFTEKQISLCITNLRGKVVEEKTLQTTLQDVENITQVLVDNIEEMIGKNPLLADKIVGVGIGIPGKLDQSQTLLVADSPIWGTFNPQMIRKCLNLPVVMDNNVRCMACGQYLFNHEQSPETFAFFHLGTGMYCANIVNGEFFEADNYIAGEIGHTIVKIDGKKCECGKRGCLQTYASERWLLKAGKLLLENNGSVILRNLVGDGPLTIDHMLTAYKLGDEIINQYIVDALKYLSMAISNLFIMMNPKKAYLHGRLFGDAEIAKRFYTYVEQDLQFMGNNYSQKIEIIPYNSLNGAIGACAKAIETFFIL